MVQFKSRGYLYDRERPPAGRLNIQILLGKTYTGASCSGMRKPQLRASEENVYLL